MNRPKATRLGVCMVATLVAVIAAFAPSAFGSISTEASTQYGTGAGPGTHTDYTIIQKFQYDSNGAEPTATTGAGQDLKKWIVDSPAGLVGNPNAIPEAKRCDPAAFDPSGSMSTYVPGSCPDSAQVGEADVYLVNDAQSGTCPAAPIQCLTAGFDMSLLAGPMHGKIYLLKTDPEFPTTLGTLFTSSSYQSLPNPPFPIACTAAPTCPLQPKTKSVLAPVTNRSDANNGETDFRIRTVPADYSNPPAALLPTAYGHASFTTGGTPLHIARIDQHLYGMADPDDTSGTPGVGDTPFLTMPSRCDSWDSYSYAFAWNGGGGSLAMDPNHLGDNTYVKSAADSYTPDCSNKPSLKATATATVDGSARNANPGLTVTVSDPTAINDEQVKKLVTTLPASMSTDVAALNNVCPTAQRDTATCPDAAQVGTATIETPLISAGLTGKVYMTTGASSSLPYLSIFVDGAIKFRLDVTTRFVGPQVNQIETTFDNLPQTPFTKFTVNITGGKPGSLLYSRECPTDGSTIADGPITFSTDGYSGNASTSSSPTSFAGCYGVNNPSKVSKCVKQGKKLSVKPKGLIATSTIANVQLLTGSKSTSLKSRAKDSSSPFSFKLTLKKSKFKKNKSYHYGYKVTYKDGHVIKTKTAKFKTCK